MRTPFCEPDRARCLGLVTGFRDRGGKADVLKGFLTRIGLPEDSEVANLEIDDVILLSRMIEGYVDAQGLLR